MKKATGPGQVETRCLPSSSGMRRLGWSLFNFDIDDATLKPEHQNWLVENLVPLFALPGVSAALRGTAAQAVDVADRLAVIFRFQARLPVDRAVGGRHEEGGRRVAQRIRNPLQRAKSADFNRKAFDFSDS